MERDLKRIQRSSRKELRDQRDIEHALEMQEAGKNTRGLPASKRYRVDPTASRTPTGYCGSVVELGLPGCTQFCEGKECYFRGVCEMQLDLEDIDKRTPEAEEKMQAEIKKALDHAKEIMKNQPDEESMSDEEYERIVRRLME